jgi:phosphatidylethanolamine-binding protein (PEBP) family uncharacterized protein
VTDIPGTGGKGDVKNGAEVLSYAGPTPPRGNHRYVFVLYEQGGSLAAISRPDSRGLFDAKALAKEHKLKPVGLQYFFVHSPEKFGGGR